MADVKYDRLEDEAGNDEQPDYRGKTDDEEGADVQKDDRDPNDIRFTSVRWLMLFCSCGFLIGSYYCYDIPGPIEHQLETDLHISPQQWGMLYSIYSYPNCVLPLFGGIFLDKIGIRKGLILFCIILTCGQLLFAYAGSDPANYHLMLAGRFIFGLGGENLSVAQSAIVTTWFKGQEMNFAFGTNISVSRLGSVIMGFTVPPMYNNHGLGFALYVGFAICVVCLGLAFCLVFIDYYREKKNPNAEQAELGADEKFKFSDIKQFTLPYWLLTASCCVTYMSVFPYIQKCGYILETKYGFDEETAGQLFGIPYFISAGLSPFLGLAVDKFGKRALIISFSSVVLIFAFFLSMFLPGCDQCYSEVYVLVLVGVAYSIYASAIWGSIPYVVNPATIGTAFGLCMAVQNIGLSIAPTVVNYLQVAFVEHEYGIPAVLAFFIAINIIGLIANVWLYIIDIKYYNGVLNRVDKGDAIKDLVNTPEASRKDLLSGSMSKDPHRASLVQYQLDDGNRKSLRQSLGSITMRPTQ